MMPGRGSAAAEHSSASSKLLSALTGSLNSPHDKNNKHKSSSNNNASSSSSYDPQQMDFSSSSVGSSATTAAADNNTVVVAHLKWHLKLKECEKGRKATVEAKLVAIRDHLTALMHLTTAAHEETTAIHRFLLGMVLAQEQMAEAFQTTSTTTTTAAAAEEDGGTDKATSTGGQEEEEEEGEEEDKKSKGEQHPGSSSSPTTALIPTLSLEQSNQLMEQKLQACAADIRGELLMGTGDGSGSGTGGTGLFYLLSTLQQQIRDLKRGQDYAEQLEDLQKRIQKAWDSYLIRANASLGLAGGPSPQGAMTTADGKKRKGKDAGALDGSSSSTLSLSVSSKTKEDLWLAEWYYRNLVSKQALAWDKASTRLARLFRSVRETECQRRISLREYLILFSEFQQKLFVGMEAASNIALMDYKAPTTHSDADESDDNKETAAASEPTNGQDEAKTTNRGLGLFGGFQKKLMGSFSDQSDAAAESGPEPTATTGTLAAREEAALRKEIESRLQTNIHQHLEQHPSPQGQQKEGDKDTIAETDDPVGDRDNILGFYQDIFTPESPLESDHVVLSTVVEKNKGFTQPGTDVMVPTGLALVVITTDNTIHLFDLRDDASADETTTITTLTSNRLQSLSPKQAYRALLEQNESEQEVTPAQSSTSQSIKSIMVEYALSGSKHGSPSTKTSTTPEPMDGPEPSVSLPLLECTLDTLQQQNSIEIVHENSSTRLELLLPSMHEQVDMINAFHRQPAATQTATGKAYV